MALDEHLEGDIDRNMRGDECQICLLPLGPASFGPHLPIIVSCRRRGIHLECLYNMPEEQTCPNCKQICERPLNFTELASLDHLVLSSILASFNLLQPITWLKEGPPLYTFMFRDIAFSFMLLEITKFHLC